MKYKHEKHSELRAKLSTENISRMSVIYFYEVSSKIISFRILALKSLKSPESQRDPDKSLFQEIKRDFRVYFALSFYYQVRS